ncbi:MAG: hypothetical protein GWM98_22070 [Nitrospinaceae bacterium]|nr:hypothetical protein [Nitrospinaceae bacterium]NIS87109.1 hypothetical protein [Nitrospinaceae bacterium]NIT83963.1 hypothetical protein [Nitrospinaceae bacterium]NIU46154.1 hypothetical protein [Nitrospinaceae bacterium]NIW07723.1 hypothetical protein [Nitrospinaceae bacterium]
MCAIFLLILSGSGVLLMHRNSVDLGNKEKKEIDTIGMHISTLDGKMHHLMERIEEFSKLSQR